MTSLIMLFEGCHTKDRKRSLRQHVKYFNFRSKIQLDHPVDGAGVGAIGEARGSVRGPLLVKSPEILYIVPRSSSAQIFHRSGLGASIYDVRTEGGRGVSPKEDVVREVA